MYQEYDSAENLPAAWDLCARNNPHLHKASLAVLERTNPCSQRYAAFFDSAGAVDSVVVLYRLRLNLLTYSWLRLPVWVTVVGVPCSVAAPGYVGGDKTRTELERYLSAERGLTVVLNSAGDLSLPGWARGTTLPTCRLRLTHSSLGDYLAAMRSHYRYRLGKALEKGRPLTVEKLTANSEFGGDLYGLYEQVHRRSDFKLEKLPLSFFQQTDADIFVFWAEGSPVGFVQLKEHGGELLFLFGGMDYAVGAEYDTYVNMLLFIVAEGMARGCEVIDFGQTAEEAKARLGCELYPRYMYVRHSNGLLSAGIGRLIRFFEYRAPHFEFRVFKGQGGQR